MFSNSIFLLLRKFDVKGTHQKHPLIKLGGIIHVDLQILLCRLLFRTLRTMTHATSNISYYQIATSGLMPDAIVDIPGMINTNGKTVATQESNSLENSRSLESRATADTSSSTSIRSISPLSSKDEVIHASMGMATSMQPLFKQNPYYYLVDALPYIDPLNEELQSEVKSLIEQELKVILQEDGGQLRNYLATLPVPKTPYMDNPNTPIGQELLRCASGKVMEKLDLSIYSSLEGPSQNRASDINEWSKSVTNAYCFLEHSHSAIINLELMIAFAKHSWIKHIADLQLYEKTLSAEVAKNRQESEEVNKRRKLEQMSCANTLRNLNREKAEILERNSKILSALSNLECEVFELRNRCIRSGILPSKYTEMLQHEFNDAENSS